MLLIRLFAFAPAALVVASASPAAAAQGVLAVTVEVVESCRIETPEGASALAPCPTRAARATTESRVRPARPPAVEPPDVPLAVVREGAYLTRIY
ncbi:MAG: hypothetical protein N2038_12575 [Geminicoccaceae bacterium]|nr:hypothetical protein [Geminicoccaceae bacterium]MCS7268449.1 hypothetical protein [Geminicoccaceae bacterium]MCX7631067.1 hypothetical protein [Geminicoccaceae bacterium]MDW8124899.1 hypothetical protein [Geminicoccaceae bacterium]MDW8340947.1 hypothetical protein [Geminicoccaceae bacterium]